VGDDVRPPELPVAAIAAPATLPIAIAFDQLDDDTALALVRALRVVEKRWHRPLSWLLIGIPTSCTGLTVVGLPVAAPMSVAFVAVFMAAIVVVPVTFGAVREEAAQLGVSPKALRALRRLELNRRFRASTDALFLAELRAAQARERKHRAHPTVLSTLRRLWEGP
jgi:hypothetical protein